MERLKRVAAWSAVTFLLFSWATVLTVVPVHGAPNPIAKTLVQGGQASGATNTCYPVIVGGTTSGGVSTILRTDSSGQLVLGASGGTQQVEGEIADGASAASTNPVVISGVDGSGNTQQLLTDTSGELCINAATGTAAGDGKAESTFAGPTSATGAARSGLGVLGYIKNGSGTYDTLRSATAVNGTTGTGLQGAGILGHDGSNYQRALVDTTGTLRFGRHMVELSDSSAVQAAAYAANDLVGGKRTLTSAVRVSGGTAHIKGVTIVDQAANSAANSVYDVILFNSDPSGTTFTENSPLDVADADMSKIVGVIRLDGVAGSTLFTNVDNNVLFKAVEVPVVQSATTSLFAALIARGGPTFAATTDVVVKMQLEQN